jgi:putative phosphoesterase
MAERLTIGVISDTHGFFDPQIPALFAGVDRILHAGDIGSLQVHDQLQEVAPVTAISGNVDEGCLPRDFSSRQTIELGGMRIFMIHILGQPSRLKPAMRAQLARLQPDVVIFGHSHQPLVQRVGTTLFLNPGSAGPKRFSLPRCLGILQIENREARAKIIPLELSSSKSETDC